MRYLAPISVAATLLLAACGGGSGGGTGSLTPAGSAGAAGSAQSQAQAASVSAAQAPKDGPYSVSFVESTNAFGDHVKGYSTYSDLDDASSATTPDKSSDAIPEKSANGACSNGVETFTPDRNGEPNSQEIIHFYEPSCVNVARDAIRSWSISGKTETVNRDVTSYAYETHAIVATANDAIYIKDAEFNSNGTPIAADGYRSQLYGSLSTIDNSKSIAWDRDLIVEPSVKGGPSEVVCSNSAGFNSSPYQSAQTIGGWNGIASGTRTRNSNGSVTWAADHVGSTIRGPVGSLGIAHGPAPQSCPIESPGEFWISGGSVVGDYNFPVSITIDNGFLQNLTITNGTLANGDTLDVVTDGVPPHYSDPNFVVGTIYAMSGGKTKVASTFDTNAFGNGTLTVYTSNPNVNLYYTIADWHVIR